MDLGNVHDTVKLLESWIEKLEKIEGSLEVGLSSKSNRPVIQR